MILLLASNISVLNSHAENDYPATLSIDVEDGTVIDDEFIFKALVTVSYTHLTLPTKA